MTDHPATRIETHYDGRSMRCFVERPASVDAMFRAAVARNPDGLAIVAGDQRLTYAALDTQVDRVAANLHAAGFAAGERIGLLVGNRVEFLLSALAATRMGAIIVPMNIRQRKPEIAYMMEHCGATGLIHEAALADELPAPSELPLIRKRYAVAGDAPGSEPFAVLLAPVSGAAPTPPANEEDAFCLLYTSGTTGRPKGAILTHLGIAHTALHYRAILGLREGEVAALAVPASHVTGLVAILLSTINVAGTSVILPEFKAAAFLETVARERISFTIMVPTMYNLCLLVPGLEGYDLSSWRVGGYGGAAMPTATIERLAEAIPTLGLSNAYGATETTSPVSLVPAVETRAHADSVGRALPCADIRVVDPDGRPVPPGEPGELWIAGPMTIPGYWANAEANRTSFVDGYWRSGDIGSIDADGWLRIHDRMKDVINRGGYKIYCVEVENVLSAHPDVLECAVLGYADAVLGERVQAFVVARPGCTPSAEALRAWCAPRLSDYKLPERVTFLADPLPRNANGKVLKPSLRTA